MFYYLLFSWTRLRYRLLNNESIKVLGNGYWSVFPSSSLIHWTLSFCWKQVIIANLFKQFALGKVNELKWFSFHHNHSVIISITDVNQMDKGHICALVNPQVHMPPLNVPLFKFLDSIFLTLIKKKICKGAIRMFPYKLNLPLI